MYQLKLAVNYLIDSLREKYGDRCINNLNDEYEIIYTQGKIHKIYIIYYY
jgi:hypothetical protein